MKHRFRRDGLLRCCLTAVFLLSGFVITACVSTVEKLQDTHITITVDTAEIEREINPLFFGACLMYWQENDADMDDGIIAERLRAMPCNLLRYPGGTDSDGYVWNTHTLHDKTRWPFEDGPGTMDTDEFIALCRDVDAEPLICVNTELVFFENGDVEKGADLAAEWVRYCNIEKGYGVKYWEIGNEPYYHSRFSAEEYGHLFLAYARAMRAVDPAIRIAAVGEWDVDCVGIKDRIPADKLAAFQAVELEYERGNWDLKQDLYMYHSNPAGGSAWWPIVMRIAGEEIDVASLHWYFDADSQMSGMSDSIAKVRQLAKTYQPDRDILVAMTEWNLGAWVDWGIGRRALAVGEAAGRLIDGGVDLGTYWPLRCEGFDPSNLLHLTEKTPTANYKVLNLLAANCGKYRVSTDSSDPSIYSFATVTGDKSTMTVFIFNRHESGPYETRVRTDSFDAKYGTAVTLSLTDAGQTKFTTSTTELARTRGEWVCTVPPLSITMVKVQQPAG